LTHFVSSFSVVRTQVKQERDAALAARDAANTKMEEVRAALLFLGLHEYNLAHHLVLLPPSLVRS